MKKPSLGTVLWLIAAVVWVHGALRRFEPEGAYLAAGLMGLAFGLLPLLPSARGHGFAAFLRALVQGGLPLAVLSVALLPVLDWLQDVLFTPSALSFHLLAYPVIGVVALLQGGCAKRIWVLIGVEWLKLKRGKLLKGGLLVAILATLLTAWSHEPLEGESGWAIAAHSLGAGFWTAEILLLVLGATAVAGEIGQGTMKMILPHAYRRAEWVAAKGTVLVIAAVLFGLLVSAAGVVYAGATQGLDDVTKLVPAGFGEDDEVQVFQTAEVMRGHLQSTIITASASLVASAMLGLLISCLFDSLVPALSASFLLFVAVKVGDILLGLPRAVLEGIYAQVPDELRELTVRLGRGFNERWDSQLVYDGWHLALLTAVMGLLAAMRLFGRRDLHG